MTNLYSVVLITFVVLSANNAEDQVQDTSCYELPSPTRKSTINYNYYNCNNLRVVVVCPENVSSSDSIPNLHPSSYYQGSCAKEVQIQNSVMPVISSNTFANYPQTNDLDIDQNHVQDILPGAFNKLPSLVNLSIVGNEMTTIRRGMFHSLGNLCKLDLGANQINHIEPDSFSSCKNLEHLDLERNNLTEILKDTFETLTKLAYLDLSHNKLTRFQFVKGMRFEILGLTDNLIDKIEDWQLSFVERLYLGNNNLDQMLEIRAENIKLFFNHNRIQTVNSSSSNNVKLLELLDLSHNSIEVIPKDFFATLVNLQDLYLENNEISKIDIELFSPLSELLYLDLASNKIEDFQRGTFSNLVQLKVLNISNNRLVELHQDLSLTNLQSLYFDHNRISTLDVAALDQQSKGLLQVSLNGNPWNCRELMLICLQLKNVAVNVFQGDSYDVENIRGIACNDSKFTSKLDLNHDQIDLQTDRVSKKLEITLNADFEHSQFYKYFQEDYKKSNFFKYLEKFVIKQEDKNHTSLALLPLNQSVDSANNSGHKSLLILIFLGQIMIFCAMIVLIYFKWQALKDYRHRNVHSESHNPILQMELS